MKNLNVAITDEADDKLNRLMEKMRLKNRADAIEWLIQTVFKQQMELEKEVVQK